MKPPVTVTTAPINAMNKAININWPGLVASADPLPVKTNFSGRVSDLYVTEGQAVKTGQPLFTVEASAETAADASTTSLPKQNTGTSQQAQTAYEAAIKEFNRYQKLYEIGGISKKQLDNAAARLQEAQGNLANNPSSANSSAAAFTGSATTSAPVDGIVTRISVAAGNTVQAEQQLLFLGSGQEKEVVISIEQPDLYLVHLGSPALIETSSQTIAGQVSSIYPEVKDNQVSVFRTHIKLLNDPSVPLELNMPVSVRIDTGKTVTVPVVPTVAILRDNLGHHFVFIVDNGKAAQKEITLGETLGEFTEITSAFPSSGMVITNNVTELKNGDPITLTQ